jgi:transposase
MRDDRLLQLALGLTPPWTVSRADFDAEAHRLDIQIDFAPGSRFACPACGAADCPAYDTERKTWRHLNFFQHQAYLTARVPRVRCEKCGIKTVAVPWARPDSGFTLLFEALVMTMVSAMPVKPPWPGSSASTTPGCGAWCTTTSIRRGRAWTPPT